MTNKKIKCRADMDKPHHFFSKKTALPILAMRKEIRQLSFIVSSASEYWPNFVKGTSYLIQEVQLLIFPYMKLQ